MNTYYLKITYKDYVDIFELDFKNDTYKWILINDKQPSISYETPRSGMIDALLGHNSYVHYHKIVSRYNILTPDETEKQLFLSGL